MPVYPHRSLRDYAESYAALGAGALVLVWMVSGCRLGNRIEYAKLLDTKNGYYETQPQVLNYCVATTTKSQCALQPSNLIPSLPGKIMTPLVWFQTDKSAPTKAVLFSAYDERQNLPFSFDAEKLELNLVAEPQTQALSETCNDRFNVEAAGTLAPMTKYEVTVGTQQVPVSGRVTMNFRITESFQGECSGTMDALYQCYIENPECSKELQDVVKGTFQPYIDADLIAPEEIAQVTDISYEVSFE